MKKQPTSENNLGFLIGLSALFVFSAGSLYSEGTYFVTNINTSGTGSLPDAILQANAGTYDVIDISSGLGTISLTTQLFVNANVTINGNGNNVSMGGLDRVFFLAGGTISINDLTIESGYAKGGNGADGGGGGAGLGGAIFVANGAAIPNSGVTLSTAVTLSNVSLNNNRAVGGAGGANTVGGLSGGFGGGGGGMGGDGGLPYEATFVSAGGGGGGFGNGANGGNGDDVSPGNGGTGAFASATSGGGSGSPDGDGHPGGAGGSSGGGGGGATDDGDSAPGGGGGIGGGNGTYQGQAGNGGWGGGGGGASGPQTGEYGGSGGFGGGSGAGSNVSGATPSAGFGGGAGTYGDTAFGGGNWGSSFFDYEHTGGGGMGAGGAIFVMQGASLTVHVTTPAAASSLFVNNSVTGGSSGGSYSTNGSEIGANVFLGADTTFDIDDSAGNVLVDGLGGAGNTSDPNVAGHTSDPNAQGGIIKNGSGTMTLTGTSYFTGTTTVNAGTLVQEGTSTTSLYQVNGGTMVFSSSGANLSAVSLEDGGTVLLEGNGNIMSDVYVSGGTMVITGADNTGSVSLRGGTLQLDAPVSLTMFDWLGGSSVAMTLDNGPVIEAGNLDLLVTDDEKANFSLTIDAPVTVGSVFELMNFASTLGPVLANDFTFTSNIAGFDGFFSLNDNTLSFEVTTVPEPEAWMLLVLGIVALFIGFRTRRSKAFGPPPQ